MLGLVRLIAAGARRILFSTGLSGTLPESVGQLAALSVLDLHSTRVSGLANFSRCESLVSLRLSNISISSLPQSLPVGLTHLYLDENPINASAGDVSALAARLPQLHALSIGIVLVPIVLDRSSRAQQSCVLQDSDECGGTRVSAPTGCRVGQSCSWTLQLYDADDQPALTGLLITGLRIGHNCSCGVLGGSDAHGLCRSQSCEHSQPMVDNRDGTFTATVPPSG